MLHLKNYLAYCPPHTTLPSGSKWKRTVSINFASCVWVFGGWSALKTQETSGLCAWRVACLCNLSFHGESRNVASADSKTITLERQILPKWNQEAFWKVVRWKAQMSYIANRCSFALAAFMWGIRCWGFNEGTQECENRCRAERYE